MWLNDPQFKASPKKWLVRSKQHDTDGNYKYLVERVSVFSPYDMGYDFFPIVKFDTKEEAEEWSNPLFEVVEVEE